MKLQGKPYEVSITTPLNTERVASIGAYIRESRNSETDQRYIFSVPYTESTLTIELEDRIIFNTREYTIENMDQKHSGLILDAVLRLGADITIIRKARGEVTPIPGTNVDRPPETERTEHACHAQIVKTERYYSADHSTAGTSREFLVHAVPFTIEPGDNVVFESNTGLVTKSESYQPGEKDLVAQKVEVQF